jgi:hypothetical protein
MFCPTGKGIICKLHSGLHYLDGADSNPNIVERMRIFAKNGYGLNCSDNLDFIFAYIMGRLPPSFLHQRLFDC